MPGFDWNSLPDAKKEGFDWDSLETAKPTDEEANDRLLLSDPMTLSALERQQAMALQQGLPPQYSVDQMEAGRKGEMGALGLMASGAVGLPAAQGPMKASKVLLRAAKDYAAPALFVRELYRDAKGLLK